MGTVYFWSVVFAFVLIVPRLSLWFLSVKCVLSSHLRCFHSFEDPDEYFHL